MKKLLALVLAFSACCVFAACGDKTAESSNDSQQSSTPQQSTSTVTPQKTKMTKEEWEKLVQFDIEQFSYTVAWDGGQMKYTFDGDYLEIIYASGNCDIFAKVGEEYYIYEKKSGRESWEVYETTQECYLDNFNEINEMAALFSYEDFQYNAVTDTYTAATLSKTDTVKDVSFKVVDGKVTLSTYTLNDKAYTVTLSYEPITITLPEVEVTP